VAHDKLVSEVGLKQSTLLGEHSNPAFNDNITNTTEKNSFLAAFDGLWSFMIFEKFYY